MSWIDKKNDMTKQMKPSSVSVLQDLIQLLTEFLIPGARTWEIRSLQILQMKTGLEQKKICMELRTSPLSHFIENFGSSLPLTGIQVG